MNDDNNDGKVIQFPKKQKHCYCFEGTVGEEIIQILIPESLMEDKEFVVEVSLALNEFVMKLLIDGFDPIEEEDESS